MLLPELREQVLWYAKQMAADKLVSARQGNLSAMDRESGLVAITPSAAEYATMTAEDVTVVDLDNRTVAGRWKPTSEVQMHTMIFRRRADVDAVMHCHAPLTSVFAATYETLPLVLLETAGCIGHHIRVAPYAVPGTTELSEVCLETMGDGTAVIMGSHGLLVVGPNLPLLYSSAISVEDNARVYLHARAIGAEARVLDEAEARVMHDEWVAGYKRTPVDAGGAKA
jgi:L-ribulose-5-phosphate 4-epimerase